MDDLRGGRTEPLTPPRVCVARAECHERRRSGRRAHDLVRDVAATDIDLGERADEATDLRGGAAEHASRLGQHRSGGAVARNDADEVQGHTQSGRDHAGEPGGSVRRRRASVGCHDALGRPRPRAASDHEDWPAARVEDLL